VHRFSPRHQFDQQVERDRLTHAPDADVDIPKGDMQVKNVDKKAKTGGQPAATDGGDDDENNTQIDAFVKNDEDGEDGGTDDDQVNGSDAGESDSVENSNTSSGGDSTDESATDHEDWTAVAYVGDEAADNLYDHGIKTVDDIDAASDDELSEVPLVGDRVIGNLRDFAESTTSD
jgi:predicted flap endonuclease-1-like 5' DNA nuclease